MSIYGDDLGKVRSNVDAGLMIVDQSEAKTWNVQKSLAMRESKCISLLTLLTLQFLGQLSVFDVEMAKLETKNFKPFVCLNCFLKTLIRKLEVSNYYFPILHYSMETLKQDL